MNHRRKRLIQVRLQETISTIVAALDEFEREVLLERQAEGTIVAKQNGKYKGRVHASIDKFCLLNCMGREYKKEILLRNICVRD